MRIQHIVVDSIYPLSQIDKHVISLHHNRYRAHFPSRENLGEEYEFIQLLAKELEKDFPLVFIHGNLHFLNIIYDAERGKNKVSPQRLCTHNKM